MSVKKKTIRIKLSVFIHPSFVKKSYRYRGIPPRIKIKKAIKITNFIPKIIADTDVVLIKKIGYEKNVTSNRFL